MELLAATRTSPLALTQVEEVRAALHRHHPSVTLVAVPMTTLGDRDLLTSLRTLGKDDFFTRDLDEALLAGRCHIAIHSAKDLPDPLPSGLAVVAFTEGLDSGDSVVLKPGITLYDLPPDARIATSSLRREDAVRALNPNLTFCDLRGTIHQRLALLDQEDVDGVVVAEAALLRLGLSHVNRMRLPGPTTPMQGRLAVVARAGDRSVADLFKSLDFSQPEKKYTQLYVGLTPPPPIAEDSGIVAVHCPLIETTPRHYHNTELTSVVKELSSYTHCIFTSKCGIYFFAELLRSCGSNPKIALEGKTLLAVGTGTANAAKTCFGNHVSIKIAPEATAEGLCSLLATLNLDESNTAVLWPHSALSRTAISDFLTTRNVRWRECILYDTATSACRDLYPLNAVDEIIFTSPSTVDAFLAHYGAFPREKALRCIGPVTRSHFNNQFKCYNKGC